EMMENDTNYHGSAFEVKSAIDTIASQGTDLLNTDDVEMTENKNQGEQDDLKKGRNWDVALQLFDHCRDQNSRWVTMRQIHVYVLWLSHHLKKVDWDSVRRTQRITVKARPFLKRVLTFTHPDILHTDPSCVGRALEAKPVSIRRKDDRKWKRVTDAPIKEDEEEEEEEEEEEQKEKKDAQETDERARNVMGSQSDANMDVENDALNINVVSTTQPEMSTEQEKTEEEIAYLKKVWGDHDAKFFVKELRWIFESCLVIENDDDELGDDNSTCSWDTIIRFVKPYVYDSGIVTRIEADLRQLNGNHNVFREEFEQFKTILNVPANIASSLFDRIRHFCESVSWEQMLWFVEFVEKYLKKCELAIEKKCELGEDEDPTIEELHNFLELESQELSKWLFTTVLRKTTNKVSWTEFRQYLREWAEQKEQVNEFFDDLQIEREAQTLLDDKVDTVVDDVKNIRNFLDSSAILPNNKKDLMKKDKEELIQMLLQSEFFQAIEERRKQEKSQNSAFLARTQVNMPTF
ncbi:exosome complex exonuclease, partial [Reticulomyxa filosa]